MIACTPTTEAHYNDPTTNEISSICLGAKIHLCLCSMTHEKSMGQAIRNPCKSEWHVHAPNIFIDAMGVILV